MEIISEKSLEEQAKKLEENAKEQIAAKNLDKAIEYYENALDIYNNLGWKGQVGILKKQIVKLESLKNLFTLNKKDEMEEKKQKFQIEKEADSLVNKAKHAVFEKKFESAVEFYEVAMKMYKEIGFNFMVQKLTREIAAIKEKINESSKPTENPKSEQEKSQKTIAEERKERILREQKIKRRQDEQRLAAIEKERQRNLELEVQRKKKMREMKMIQQNENKNESKSENENKIEDWFVPEIASFGKKSPQSSTDEKLKKLRKLNEEKERQENLLHEAEKWLDDAKNYADQKDFEKAKKLYRDSAEKFTMLGWVDQAETIRREIDILDEKQKEILERKKLEEEIRIHNQREIDELIKKDREELERLRQLEEEEANKRDPDVQRKIDMAKMNISKGKTAEEKGKVEEAIQRYEVSVELFEEAHYREDKIKELKNIIEKLKSA